MCTDCSKQKATLPGKDKSKKLVCDACYGVLLGMVGDDVPVLSIEN